MMKLVVLIVGLALLFGANAKRPSISLPQEASEDAQCILCGIVVNELQGMLSENITETEIEKIIRKDTCDFIKGKVSAYCNQLVDNLPNLINDLNNLTAPGVVCVSRGYCEAPFSLLTDPQPVHTNIIDLDLPPIQRWSKICANDTYKAVMGNLIHALGDFFDNSTLVVDLGRTINKLYFPSDLSLEIQGCAAAMGVEYGWLTWVNLGYEVTEACTSIVAQTKAGKIFHVRNMDFWDGIWLTNHLKNLTMTIEYQQGGKTLFYATTFAGYVGVLSGMKPGAFSISLNTRYYPSHGLKNLLYEVVAAIVEKNSTLTSFLTRQVITSETTFDAAVSKLSTGPLIADVYYIVGGLTQNQGVVLSRNRENTSDYWSLNSTTWYLAQTNYDHWKKAPWFDDRVVPANNAMLEMGQDNVNLDSLFKVLSVKPVLNIQTTFTMLTSAADGPYTSLTRWCQYPCVE